MKPISAGAAVSIVMLTVASAAVAQPADFQPLDSWAQVRLASTEASGNTLVVRRGTIRTTRLYSDFVLRFEFRLPEPDAEGRVFVRSRFDYGKNNDFGYGIQLTRRSDTDHASGRVSGVNVGLKVLALHPAPLVEPFDGWQQCEVGVKRSKLEVRVNGALVSEADDLDEFTGYVALQASRGRIEFRNVRAAREPSANDPFGQGAYRVSEPDVTTPKVLRSVSPFYPIEPHAAKVQGVVQLELVVDSSGLAGDIRVLKPLHPDLDEAAIAAARQWRFSPATKAGQIVPVIVTMEISFQLRN
jgi:TonB family protein